MPPEAPSELALPLLAPVRNDSPRQQGGFRRYLRPLRARRPPTGRIGGNASSYGRRSKCTGDCERELGQSRGNLGGSGFGRNPHCTLTPFFALEPSPWGTPASV